MKKLILLLLLLSLPLTVFSFGGGGWSDEDPFFTKGDLTSYMLVKSVADDGEIVLPTGIAGFGYVTAGDGEEWMQVHFTSAGVVTKVSGTTNTANTDSDGNLCVHDKGSGIAVKNRLAATKKIRFIFYYSKQ